MTAPALDAILTVTVGDSRHGGFTVESQLRLDAGVLVLFGPSGAGKSLTLQALAGLQRPRAGRIVVGDETLSDAATGIFVPTHRRRIGYVPQHHALFPFCTVARNVTFGLPRAQRRRGADAVRPLLEELGIAGLADAYPASLSGGERQRVALARALAPNPRLLLLDEPFASIDHAGRRELRGILRATLERHGIPAVFVTHDREEALELADTVVRFERGRTVATGSPADVLGDSAVRVTGTVIGEPEPVALGRSRVTVERAVIELPDALLPTDGTVDIRLSGSAIPRPASDDDER